jgi:3-hydroxybutyryl-CoA dehydratase
MAFQTGDSASTPYTFDEACIVAFAHKAGDKNPLHYDFQFASRSRFKGVIASGSHMSGVLMGAGATFISREEEAVGLEFTFRFERAIRAGTQTKLNWTVTDIAPHTKLGGTLVTCEGAIVGLDGTLYVTSTGKAVVWDKPLHSG